MGWGTLHPACRVPPQESTATQNLRNDPAGREDPAPVTHLTSQEKEAKAARDCSAAATGRGCWLPTAAGGARTAHREWKPERSASRPPVCRPVPVAPEHVNCPRTPGGIPGPRLQHGVGAGQQTAAECGQLAKDLRRDGTGLRSRHSYSWRRGVGRGARAYLPFQQKACEVLVAVQALWEVHLHGGERPANSIWKAGR